jgi:dTDP-4-amino-4,6-dideoxygalactose transaminase
MNSRLDEIQSAVLRIGLPKLDSMNEKRKQIIEQYSKALKEPKIRLVTSFQPGNVAHLAVLEIPEDLGRDRFQKHLKDRGISTDIHYPILDCDQIGLEPDARETPLTNSRRFASRVVSIPLFPELTDREVSQICLALENIDLHSY